MKRRVALITWRGLPEGAESERLLLPHLEAADIDAQIVDWRDAGVNFSQFDLVVLRSCWDYHLRGAEFTEWLRRTSQTVRILNDPRTVLWNRNKFYLRELQAQGIEIAPTVFVAGGEEIGKAERATIEGWQKFVVKPAVSASAHNTWLADGAAFPADAELQQKMHSEAFLIQQFIPEIETGEISFIYLDGGYSHAVLKRPAAGDFRVQQEHGGSAEGFVPSPALLDQANKIAAAVPYVRDSLYCRIDVIEKDGRLIVMELELIEPELFLGLADGAAKRFAAAILHRLS
jgi:glutathione synthase/RimK-type ligase-like ATP-grasp enzyme